MNLQTARTRANPSEPSEGTSSIVCSSSRYCEWSTQRAKSSELQFSTHHFGQYDRPEAVQVVLAESTHKNPNTKIDLGLNDGCRSVLQGVDQLFLDRWKRCQELILLTTEQDI
jgi:hypothetical protein